MINSNIVSDLILGVINELNNELQTDNKIKESVDTILIGEEGSLDSIGFVNFITMLEEKIDDKFQIALVLTEDEELIFSDDGPFRTVGSLAKYISECLSEGDKEVL